MKIKSILIIVFALFIIVGCGSIGDTTSSHISETLAQIEVLNMNFHKLMEEEVKMTDGTFL